MRGTITLHKVQSNYGSVPASSPPAATGGFFYVLILSDNLPTYKGKFVFFIELLKIPLPLSIRICRPHCPLQSLYATSDGLFIV